MKPGGFINFVYYNALLKVSYSAYLISLAVPLLACFAGDAVKSKLLWRQKLLLLSAINGSDGDFQHTSILIEITATFLNR